MTTVEDTGERRRRTDRMPVITELLDEATLGGIVEEAWLALVGDEEFLVPSLGGPVSDAVSSWVEVVGPWTGSVVLTCARPTAEELARCLLKEHAPPVLDAEDVEDALGELANVVGGNVKGILPGPSVLGLPQVGAAPGAGAPDDTCCLHLLWRGRALTISAQGSPGGVPSAT
ncbi:MAG TPA: chemotaxis protein CheX [Blastococcus sp.]